MNDYTSDTALGRTPFFREPPQGPEAIAAGLGRVDGKVLSKAPEAPAPEALSQRRHPALPSPIEGGGGTREFPVGAVQEERQAMARLGGGLK